MSKGWALGLTLGVCLMASVASGENLVVERTVARFSVPELGGPKRPRFVFERILAFEARLEALADPDRGSDGIPYRERHVRAALERHIAETILASLRIEPEPPATVLEAQTQAAQTNYARSAGGAEAIMLAAHAEGLSESEVVRLARRTARASLYLDRMVTPLLTPTEAELHNLQRRLAPQLRATPFENLRPLLRREYTARRLSNALSAYYDSLRSRLELVVLGSPGLSRDATISP